MDLLRLWSLPVLAGMVIGSVIVRFATPQVFQGVSVVIAAINAAKLLTEGVG